jgi:acylphosphatase
VTNAGRHATLRRVTPDPPTTRVRRRVHVTGRVQGVWYRGATEVEAKKLGLDGWVRNLPDGSVEALVEGEATAVEALVDWCRVGPPAARVRDVVATSEPIGGDLAGFRVRH